MDEIFYPSRGQKAFIHIYVYQYAMTKACTYLFLKSQTPELSKLSVKRFRKHKGWPFDMWTKVLLNSSCFSSICWCMTSRASWSKSTCSKLIILSFLAFTFYPSHVTLGRLPTKASLALHKYFISYPSTRFYGTQFNSHERNQGRIGDMKAWSIWWS